MKRKSPNHLGRRMFLRGSGVVIGLPLLEYMLNDHGTAYADGSRFPCRYLTYVAPSSIVAGDSTIGQQGFFSTQEGFDYPTAGTSLEPLEARGIADRTSVVSNLFTPMDGSARGSYPTEVYHGDAFVAMLTGENQGSQSYQPQGFTADWLVGSETSPAGGIDHIVCCVDPSGATDGSHSYAPNGQQVEPQFSPLGLYGQLIDGFVPPKSPKGEPMPDPEAELRRRVRVSSLSYAGDQMKRLAERVGACDRIRLEQHYDELRALEMRLAELDPGTSSGAGCEDPKIGADPANVGGIPDQSARSALFNELIKFAFACNITQSASLAMSLLLTGPGMRHALWDPGALHDQLNHGIGGTHTQADLDEANAWMVDQFARLCASLRELPEGDGTVFDHLAAVYCNEGGGDGRMADGGGDPNHSTDNAVMLVAGGARGLNAQGGQHLRAPNDTHPAVVFNTAIRAVLGSNAPGLGEFTEDDDFLPELFG